PRGDLLPQPQGAQASEAAALAQGQGREARGALELARRPLARGPRPRGGARAMGVGGLLLQPDRAVGSSGDWARRASRTLGTIEASSPTISSRPSFAVPGFTARRTIATELWISMLSMIPCLRKGGKCFASITAPKSASGARSRVQCS